MTMTGHASESSDLLAQNDQEKGEGMSPEQITQRIAKAIEGDYPEVLLIAHVDSDPTTVWVEATDNDGVTGEFRLTVESQP